MVFCCNILKWFSLLAPRERHKYYVSGDHQDALIGSSGCALNTHAALIKSSLVRVYASSMLREKQVVYLSFPGALMKRSMPHSFNFNPPPLHNEVTLFWGKIFTLYVRNTCKQHNFLAELRASRHKHTRSLCKHSSLSSSSAPLKGPPDPVIDGHGQLRLLSVIRHCHVFSHLSPDAERTSAKHKLTATKCPRGRATESVA